MSSTTTGGLPGPATIARLLDWRAAFATAGPPVTQINFTPRWLKSWPADSSDGSATSEMRLSTPMSR